jgi:hypothetical protein
MQFILIDRRIERDRILSPSLIPHVAVRKDEFAVIACPTSRVPDRDN